MFCPNCGLEHPDTAKFCSNCGTPFGSGPVPPSDFAGSQRPAQTPYPMGMRQGTMAAANKNTTTRNIAVGCLIALLIVLFFGLSCTRACFRMGHGRANIHRRY